MNALTMMKPAARREFWKYSRIDPAMILEFGAYVGGESQSPGITIPFVISGSRRLFFINGVFSPEHSDVGQLPAGVELARLADAPGVLPVGVTIANALSPFTAANSDGWQDGLRLELADGVHLAEPVEIVHISDESAENRRLMPRNQITAGRGSSAMIIETYLSDPRGDESAVLTIPVTEVVCGPGARIEHIKLINPGHAALHVGATFVSQAADSRYYSRELLLGGEKTRSELHVDLNGRGANCDIAALYVAGDGQHHDTRTRVNHNAPGCETRELYKGILDGESQTVFDGQITVARDAQKTAAHQTNRNLLLSDKATAHSIPRLEIYADDVKCSHGSTTGQLSDDELFYLRTRGIDQAAARRMLALAFASEVLDDIQQPELRKALLGRVTARLGAMQAESVA